MPPEAAGVDARTVLHDPVANRRREDAGLDAPVAAAFELVTQRRVVDAAPPTLRWSATVSAAPRSATGRVARRSRTRRRRPASASRAPRQRSPGRPMTESMATRRPHRRRPRLLRPGGACRRSGTRPGEADGKATTPVILLEPCRDQPADFRQAVVLRMRNGTSAPSACSRSRRRRGPAPAAS